MSSNKYNIPIGTHYISFNTKSTKVLPIDLFIYSILKESTPQLYICVIVIKHINTYQRQIVLYLVYTTTPMPFTMTFLFGVFHTGLQIRGNRSQYEEKYYE